ncbi:metallophosphoesterase [Aeromonas sp. SrichE-2G]|uniref:metallophosphoesterase n=1 Tax=Aeromonas sp. SrichE-2G TaxID=2823359 RepID=UPI001B338A0C|nr:metallophosphoesterase [Aeromonas sp. SrichE-2G]MBP4040922.1 metallophosphoesterase [Aeromonas sp. SrichE-2G]
MTPSPLIRRFSPNRLGRDLAVGDIHGYFALLQQALDSIDFDPERDRLFSVGDLTDRGPECAKALDWLARPWFHPVCGNHDDYVCRHESCDRENWIQNGGGWFALLSQDEQALFAARYRTLPLAIEVQTRHGPVGLLHADCPFPTWQGLLDRLEAGVGGGTLRAIKNVCLWSRRRIEQLDESGIEDLVALVVGHTPVSVPVRLGNVYYIDTGGWYPHAGGYFTLLDLDSLTPLFPER